MEELVVCDFGELAEKLCQFLEQELPVGIKRVVDPKNLDEMSNQEIREAAIEVVRPYVNKVKVIVIANPLVTAVALESLKAKFLSQEFVGYGQGMAKMIRALKRVAVLVSPRIKQLECYQKVKAACREAEITEPDCRRWTYLVDRGWLAKEEATEEVKRLNGAKVIICDPELLVRKQRVEEMVGWRSEVVDMREEVLALLKDAMGFTAWK